MCVIIRGFRNNGVVFGVESERKYYYLFIYITVFIFFIFTRLSVNSSEFVVFIIRDHGGSGGARGQGHIVIKHVLFGNIIYYYARSIVISCH